MAAEDKHKPKPTQITEKGLELGIPTREEFLRNMDKVAPPANPEPEPESDKAEKP